MHSKPDNRPVHDDRPRRHRISQRSYLAGILAGLGVGYMLGMYAASFQGATPWAEPELWILACACIALGSYLNKRGDEDRDEKAGPPN